MDENLSETPEFDKELLMARLHGYLELFSEQMLLLQNKFIELSEIVNKLRLTNEVDEQGSSE